MEDGEVKLSEFIKELYSILNNFGDMTVTINCSDLKKWLKDTNQNYKISSPSFLVVEDRDGVNELMIRDWIY